METRVIHLKKESLFDSMLKKPFITKEDKLRLDVENRMEMISILKLGSEITESLLKLQLSCKDQKIQDLENQLNCFNNCWKDSIQENSLLRVKASKLRKKLKELRSV